MEAPSEYLDSQFEHDFEGAEYQAEAGKFSTLPFRPNTPVLRHSNSL